MTSLCALHFNFSVFPKTAMINPSDREEVDHSFFDSDCDNGSLSSSTGKLTARGLKAKKETQQTCDKPRAKPTTISRDGLSLKSVGRRKPPEEGDDTVTDVTSLSTPDCSPLQSLDLNHTETEEESVRQQQQHRSAPSSGLSKVHQAKDLGRNVDQREYSSSTAVHCLFVFLIPPFFLWLPDFTFMDGTSSARNHLSVRLTSLQFIGRLYCVLYFNLMSALI